MTWFTASVIVAIKPLAESAGPIQVYENNYLIEATDFEEARKKADVIGKSEVSVQDDELTLDGAPAKWVYIGVRKIMTVSNPTPLDLDKDKPLSGTELNYSVYQVADDETLEKLANGGAVTVQYLE